MQAFGEQAPFASGELHDPRYDAAGPGGSESGHRRRQERRLVGPVGDERPDGGRVLKRRRLEGQARLAPLPEFFSQRGGVADQGVEEVGHDDGVGGQVGEPWRGQLTEARPADRDVRYHLNQERHSGIRRGLDDARPEVLVIRR